MMKSTKKSTGLILASTLVSMTVAIQGKVVSITHSEFEVAGRQSTFYLLKDKLPEAISRTLEHPGSAVTVYAQPDWIEKIVPAHKRLSKD